MSTAKLKVLITRIVRSLWFTPALCAAFAVLALLLAPVAAPFLPQGMMALIGLDGVYDLLQVLANTLLAVAIFSLAILASAMRAAADTATPRARPLLMQDRTAQNAISTFIGGFVFAIVGIVGLSTDYFDDWSRVILFIATCLVIVAVIYALIGWDGDVLAARVRRMMEADDFANPNPDANAAAQERHAEAVERVRQRWQDLKSPRKRPSSSVGNLEDAA